MLIAWVSLRRSPVDPLWANRSDPAKGHHNEHTNTADLTQVNQIQDTGCTFFCQLVFTAYFEHEHTKINLYTVLTNKPMATRRPLVAKSFCHLSI